MSSTKTTVVNSYFVQGIWRSLHGTRTHDRGDDLISDEFPFVVRRQNEIQENRCREGWKIGVGGRMEGLRYTSRRVFLRVMGQSRLTEPWGKILTRRD